MAFSPRTLKRFSETAAFRADWALLGVRFLRSSGFDASQVQVGNQVIQLKFPEGEEEGQIDELGTILQEDCYGLRELSVPPSKILDVGGNVGLFSLVARARFPEALIHTYEPWPKLQPILENNLAGLDVHLHSEAVGKESGNSTMVDRGPSGAALNQPDQGGAITRVAFSEAIERMGGQVDLLKLDCEGGEWEIFDCQEAWESVDRLVMEYHLWAGDHSLQDLIQKALELGFHIDFLSERHTAFNGILWASREVKGSYGQKHETVS